VSINRLELLRKGRGLLWAEENWARTMVYREDGSACSKSERCTVFWGFLKRRQME
jgi:hypothetical protein